MTIREQILAATDKLIEAVHVAEWGVTVFVHEMDGIERQAWYEAVRAIPDKDAAVRVFVTLLVRTVRDELGQPIFDVSDTGQAEMATKKQAVLTRLYDIAARVNGLRHEDESSAAKNS